MQTITNDKLDAMLRKVQALLAQADHPNTGVAEAETFRAKAEALMYKYRIDEAVLAAAAPVGDETNPEWRFFDVCHYRSEFAMHYRHIANGVMEHVGIRGVFKHKVVANQDPETGEPIPGQQTDWYYAEVVGYDAELRIAEALYVSCMLAFQTRLEPKYDPTLSDQVNAFNMRMAGMEGWRIAQAIFGRTDKSLRPKVRKMFKDEAIARGEDPTILLGKGNSVKAFREDFATGFVLEIRNRLTAMRVARAELDEGAIVLASRNEKINEMFYAVYPQYRPVATTNKSGLGTVATDPRRGCVKCAKAKSGYCNDHRYLKPRVYRGGRSTNYAAVDRGRSAARSVDLGGAPRSGRLEG